MKVETNEQFKAEYKRIQAKYSSNYTAWFRHGDGARRDAEKKKIDAEMKALFDDNPQFPS